MPALKSTRPTVQAVPVLPVLPVLPAQPQLFLSDVERLQTLPLAGAASEVGRGPTQFKLDCRSLGVKQWPYRVLSKLTSGIEALAKHGETCPSGTSSPSPCAEVPTSDWSVWKAHLEVLYHQLSTRKGNELKSRVSVPGYVLKALSELQTAARARVRASRAVQ